jgi:hypothetical protein
VRNGGGAPVDDAVEIDERGAIDLGERTIRRGQRGASPGYAGWLCCSAVERPCGCEERIVLSRRANSYPHPSCERAHHHLLLLTWDQPRQRGEAAQ